MHSDIYAPAVTFITIFMHRCHLCDFSTREILSYTEVMHIIDYNQNLFLINLCFCSNPNSKMQVPVTGRFKPAECFAIRGNINSVKIAVQHIDWLFTLLQRKTMCDVIAIAKKKSGNDQTTLQMCDLVASRWSANSSKDVMGINTLSV
jgi:hypothetical protein